MIKATIPFLLLALFACSNSDNDPDPGKEPGPAPGEVVTYGNESLVAVDPAGKEIAFDYRAPRDKKVGIFYFIWLGAHGYDTGDYFGGDIIPPKATDTRSPYDISELEKGHSDPADIPFGPGGAMHHWGKPYLDYYVSNDTWVIRRHAQMLSEAGVDVIFIDVTNGYAYLPVVRTLCDVYNQMLREGNPRPKISFILNTNPAPVVQELLTLYGNSDYDRLWYELDGKPLLLAPPGDYGAGVSERLTFRYAWFDTQFGYGGPWYGDGTNRWAWGEFSPQRNVKEEIPFLSVKTVDNVTYTESIECPVVEVQDDSMYQGESKVLDAGVPGEQIVNADIAYLNGVEQERTVLSTQVTREATNKVIAVGTKVRPSWLPNGYFIWPVYGRITSYFGYRSIFGSYSYHGGIDIATSYGTNIAAADGGTVVFAGRATGSMWSYGNLVIVDHGNGKQTYYGHCSSVLVSAGDKVYQGQPIAKVGSTGRSTGNHCHFEVKINGTSVNPLSYLS